MEKGRKVEKKGEGEAGMVEGWNRQEREEREGSGEGEESREERGGGGGMELAGEGGKRRGWRRGGK